MLHVSHITFNIYHVIIMSHITCKEGIKKPQFTQNVTQLPTAITLIYLEKWCAKSPQWGFLAH